MKILYVITKSEIGGAQTHVSQLVDHFSKRGDSLYVMCYPGGWLEESVRGKAEFVPNLYFSNSFNPLRALKAILEIRKFVKKNKPDLVHCHSSGAATFARLAVLGKIPTVYTAHGWGFNIGTKFPQKIVAIFVEKALSIFTHRIICVSDFVKNLGIKYRITNPRKFIVIHNGVKLLDKSSVKDGSVVQLITVGRLAKPKLPEKIVEVLNSLPEETKNKLKLIVLGGGPKKLVLDEAVSRGSLAVENLDVPLEEVGKHLVSSDIFVLISQWEGFPYSILEAMGAGLPIVASNVGGISEAVVNVVNGFLVKNEDNSILEALTSLIKDPELRKKMGDQSLRMVGEKFSETIMFKKTEEVYKNLLKV